ncbi:hypothetical protein OJ998_13165 [Solirubrobacter taibaiensis]|nr:hypothetical protein [Solirubrobacter taibaiensis]
MRKLLGTFVLAAMLAGCGGSSEPQTPKAATPTATAETESEEQHDLEGYSPGVVEYYGQAHAHEDSEAGSIEAEYHQPPKPAEAKLGETITLTGTEIGVRFDVTVTDVKPVEDDLMAVYVTLESTGIAIYDRPMEQASITYPGEEPTPLDPEASAKCSNGLDGIVRIDVLRNKKGCLLFPRSGDAMPERFQLALEVVPTIAGGIWNLG